MKRIRSLAGLEKAALERRAVVAKWNCLRKPSPATWVLNWPGFLLARALRAGLYLYDPKKRPQAGFYS